MQTNQHGNTMNRLSAAGVLITMGVVYGDIGTSPLYVMKAIIEGNGGLKNVSEDFVIGAVSLVFWTLTLLTTVKYVMIALKADNHGEGGIFSLYTLVRKKAKWLIIPAMIGGAALLADSVLTPAVTVTTAIEGLRGIPSFYSKFGDNQHVIIVITIVIISVLFMIQRFGTEKVGKTFGPIMFCWFTFLGVLGFSHAIGDLSVFRAINPYYAVKLLFSPNNLLGIFILGNIFLCTTGAEALYSDLGHVGRKNIYFSWPYIKVCLLLNYFGQAAWIIKVKDMPHYQNIEMINPFFQIMPASIMIFGVVFATVAAVIASQALISGAYTLVSEAIKLKLLPRLKIIYPSRMKGQLYIPVVNNILWITCIALIVYFKTSMRMEAAYGLAITVTMLMTTILLVNYLLQKHVPKILSWLIFVFFGGLETMFFISSAQKFTHGGYVAVLMALVILVIMYIWIRGYDIVDQSGRETSLDKYKKQLACLKADDSIPYFATNLIYLSSNLKGHMIGKEILYSILDKRPKRAEVYWFVNVEVTDEPYTKEYVVDMMDTDFIVNVQLRLGFKIPQEVNVYLRQIVKDLMDSGKLPKQPQKYTTIPQRQVGDFCFVLIREELSSETQLKNFDRLVLQMKLAIKKITVSPVRWFGLEYSEVNEEHVPLMIGHMRHKKLTRVDEAVE